MQVGERNFMKRLVSGIMLTLLLTSMLTLAFGIQPIKGLSTGTIYIRADGSVDPHDAPIQRNGDSYALIGNLTSGIVIERDDITLDGGGYELRSLLDVHPPLDTVGVFLFQRTNVTIRNMRIILFGLGFYLNATSKSVVTRNNITLSNSFGQSIGGAVLWQSSNNNVSGNNILCPGDSGISLQNSSYNNVCGNNITYGSSLFGATAINVYSSSNNNISGNQITNPGRRGIFLYGSSNNNTVSGNGIVAGSFPSSDSDWPYGVWDGLFLGDSSSNSISENIFVNCSMRVSTSYQNMVSRNLVNGKPLIYLEGVSDRVVNNAGQVILVNCNRITVENVEISRTTVGVELWETHHSKIVGCNITYSIEGVILSSSSYNTISGGYFDEDILEDIMLSRSSNYNTISQNKLKALDWDDYSKGISLVESHCNTISENDIEGASALIYLYQSRTNTIYRNSLHNFYDEHWAIELDYSSFNNLTENKIESPWGVTLTHSDKSIFSGNRIVCSQNGLRVRASSYNTIYGNNFEADYYGKWFGIGIVLSDPRLYDPGVSVGNIVSGNNVTGFLYNGGMTIASSSNSIYHNSFSGNAVEVTREGEVNAWDNGYPSGGNYWSNYTGVDTRSGPNQVETESDGIGDTPYDIDENNQDRYPLMGPFNIFDAGTWNGTAYNVDVVSNSTVSGFQFNPSEGALLRFNVTGEDGTSGFWRVTIPKDLLWAEHGWTVYVGEESVNYTIIPDNGYTYLYFTYNHSTKTVLIQGTHVIPEFPSALIMPLLMTLTMLAVVLAKKRFPRKPES